MPRWNRFEDGHAGLGAIVRPLVETGLLEPLADRDDDAQLWLDCELGSFVENRFHHLLDPEALSPDQRTAWSARALASDERLQDPRRCSLTAAFWIVEGGVRAGTIALSQSAIVQPFMPVFSLYVFRRHRGSGLAYRAMRAVYEASVAAGFLGIRLSTFWTWQPAVRRYLFRYAMWAWSFKRSLDFAWAGHLPAYTVTVDDHQARFAIDHGGAVELLTASRDGELLEWNELPAMRSGALDASMLLHARSTFAVALATHGWPLLRAGDDLDEVAGADIGGPDVLAHKIAVFEALDRRDGFDVRTPRIPGVPYEAIARELAQ